MCEFNWLVSLIKIVIIKYYNEYVIFLNYPGITFLNSKYRAHVCILCVR